MRSGAFEPLSAIGTLPRLETPSELKWWRNWPISVLFLIFSFELHPNYCNLFALNTDLFKLYSQKS